MANGRRGQSFRLAKKIYCAPQALSPRPPGGVLWRRNAIAEETNRWRTLATLAEIDQRIAGIRENLRELVEQAAAFSGAADDDRTSQRIADQQAQLDRLTKEREEIVQQNEVSGLG